MAEASGLAGKVRRCQGSDEFDLAGKSQAACEDLVKTAFVEPFVLKQMIKITFVVGAGKAGRQKYGDALPRDFMCALNNIGFDSDDAACTELSAAGRYKYQHDTSKNLLFVHVFPRVVAPEGDAEAEGEDGAPAERVQRSPAEVLAECEMDDFQRMVTAHVTTYTTKKRLLDSIREKLAKLEEAEQKMIAREAVDATLQNLYDTLSADGLKAKVKVMAVELQASIDGGELTSDERTQVMEQLDNKLSSLGDDLKKAEADGKAKLQAKLEEGKEKLQTQKAAVSDAKSAPARPLKYAAEIQRLHRKLGGIAKLEKENSGKFTLDELKRIGERPELEEAIVELIRRSQMWFETDEELDVRVRVCKQQAGASKPKASSAGYPAAKKDDGWSTQKKR